MTALDESVLRNMGEWAVIARTALTDDIGDSSPQSAVDRPDGDMLHGPASDDGQNVAAVGCEPATAISMAWKRWLGTMQRCVNYYLLQYDRES